ncbi:MAG: DUF6462 family protein [Lachnospiraceae bacterium]|nr:DUF6462 family protein [Lachnospiraceae bacterium]
MNAGIRDDSARMLTVQQGAAYTGMGRTSFMEWAKKIGARRTFGPKMTRYDRKIIDAALDSLGQSDK